MSHSSHSHTMEHELQKHDNKKLFTWVNIHHLPILKVASHYAHLEALKYIGIVYSTEAVLHVFSHVGYEHITYL